MDLRPDVENNFECSERWRLAHLFLSHETSASGNSLTPRISKGNYEDKAGWGGGESNQNDWMIYHSTGGNVSSFYV